MLWLVKIFVSVRFKKAVRIIIAVLLVYKETFLERMILDFTYHFTTVV